MNLNQPCLVLLSTRIHRTDDCRGFAIASLWRTSLAQGRLLQAVWR